MCLGPGKRPENAVRPEKTMKKVGATGGRRYIMAIMSPDNVAGRGYGRKCQTK